MLCTCLGYIEIDTYHFTFSNMGGSKNGPLKASLRETRFKWKIVKMVDLVGKIQFEIYG